MKPKFNIEKAVTEWRTSIASGEALSGPSIEELEGHLREEIDNLSATGLSPEESYLIARRRLGEGDPLEEEFGRAHSPRIWTRRVFWMLLGFVDLTACLLMVEVAGRLGSWASIAFGGADNAGLWTLASHGLGLLLVLGIMLLTWRWVILPGEVDIPSFVGQNPVWASMSILGMVGFVAAISFGIQVWMASRLGPEVLGSMLVYSNAFTISLKAVAVVAACVVLGFFGHKAFAPGISHHS